MTFLPQGYTQPEQDNGYMKLKLGANKFRILSPAIVGFIYWNKDKKPVRSKQPFEYVPEDIRVENGKADKVKHFWAFVVWNYDAGAIQILELTQATIQGQLKIKIDNREGNATGNDFIVTRTGEGLDTEYDVDVTEASPIKAEIEIAYKAKNINLEALFTGEDPFGSKTPTPRNETGELKPEYSKEQAESDMTPEEKEFVEDTPF